MSNDVFGIKQIYSTAPGGRVWLSKWNNGKPRSWNDQANDPYDPEFITKYKSTDSSWMTDGHGILFISGYGPRMYVIDPAQKKYWHNVEITVYGYRYSDSGIDWGGIVSLARTNHYIDTNYCDTRGYAGRMRYDGDIDFEKETKHTASIALSPIPNPGGFGMKVWVGYKFVVYDLFNGNVKLELYRDDTDGKLTSTGTGGSWRKIREFIDTGNNFAVNGVKCKTGINPALRLTNIDARPGSETNKANLSVYFRSDGVGQFGLWYKKASVREIIIP